MADPAAPPRGGCEARGTRPVVRCSRPRSSARWPAATDRSSGRRRSRRPRRRHRSRRDSDVDRRRRRACTHGTANRSCAGAIRAAGAARQGGRHLPAHIVRTHVVAGLAGDGRRQRVASSVARDVEQRRVGACALVRCARLSDEVSRPYTLVVVIQVDAARDPAPGVASRELPRADLHVLLGSPVGHCAFDFGAAPREVASMRPPPRDNAAADKRSAQRTRNALTRILRRRNRRRERVLRRLGPSQKVEADRVDHATIAALADTLRDHRAPQDGRQDDAPASVPGSCAPVASSAGSSADRRSIRRDIRERVLPVPPHSGRAVPTASRRTIACSKVFSAASCRALT